MSRNNGRIKGKEVSCGHPPIVSVEEKGNLESKMEVGRCGEG